MTRISLLMALIASLLVAGSASADESTYEVIAVQAAVAVEFDYVNGDTEALLEATGELLEDSFAPDIPLACTQFAAGVDAYANLMADGNPLGAFLVSDATDTVAFLCYAS